MSARTAPVDVSVLELMAEAFEAYAKANDEVGEALLENGQDSTAQRAFGSRDAHRSCAKMLRAVLDA